MMAGLFLIYFISALLIFWRRKYVAFALMVLNLVLSVFMLFHHATDVLKIRL